MPAFRISVGLVVNPLMYGCAVERQHAVQFRAIAEDLRAQCRSGSCLHHGRKNPVGGFRERSNTDVRLPSYGPHHSRNRSGLPPGIRRAGRLRYRASGRRRRRSGSGRRAEAWSAGRASASGSRIRPRRRGSRRETRRAAEAPRGARAWRLQRPAPSDVPRATSGWLVTTTSAKPAALSRASASATPGSTSRSSTRRGG